jgi:hypothetical protein
MRIESIKRTVLVEYFLRISIKIAYAHSNVDPIAECTSAEQGNEGLHCKGAQDCYPVLKQGNSLAELLVPRTDESGRRRAWLVRPEIS